MRCAKIPGDGRVIIQTAMKHKIMGISWIENILSKIAEYLPDEEPQTEQERVYEEGKKRVYEMHQKEQDIFYADEAWLEDGRGKVYGEIAAGTFCPFEQAVFLDVHGEPLLEAQIAAVEKLSEEQEDTETSEKKIYLIFDEQAIREKEEFFARTYYVIKKH